jgi:hypothetical protein
MSYEQCKHLHENDTKNKRPWMCKIETKAYYCDGCEAFVCTATKESSELHYRCKHGVVWASGLNLRA